MHGRPAVDVISDLGGVLLIALGAAVVGLGLGIVLSRTVVQWIADRASGDDEEPDDRID